MMFPNYIPDWNNPKSTFIKKNETSLRVDFQQSGGQIYVYGSDRPDLMRGPNPMGVILDEFSVQKKVVWEEIVQPIMRANPRAWCWFLFTPRGRNHAYNIFQYGQEERDKEWKSWKMTVADSGIFIPNQIEAMRKTSTSQTFSQEYMCEFLEGEGSVFRGVREAMTATAEKPMPGHYYVMGVDLAKVQDFTVITVFDRQTNKQVYQDRFQTIEWPFQKKKIFTVAKHYNNALCIVDATGIGDPIVDDLLRYGVQVEPYKITSESKKDMIEKLSIYIEQKKVGLLPIEESAFEFDNYTYDIGPTGRVRYGAQEGFHDDIVTSLALAVTSLQPIMLPMPTIEMSPLQQFYKSQVIGGQNEDQDNDLEPVDWE